MRIKQKSCIRNPKTGRYFTRHNYTQENLRVTTYVRELRRFCTIFLRF